jgi:hypothetical protein
MRADRYFPMELDQDQVQKELQRIQIANDTATFEAMGGKIQYLKRGESGIDKPSKILKLFNQRLA